MLPALIETFERRHPGVTPDFLEGSTEVLEAALLEGRCEVALMYDIGQHVAPVHEHQLGLFARAGVSPRIRYQTSSYELVRSRVARNLGFTLLISHPYGDVSYEGRPLVAVPLAGTVKPVDVVLARAPAVRQTLRAQAFAAHCRELLPKLPAGVSGAGLARASAPSAAQTR